MKIKPTLSKLDKSLVEADEHLISCNKKRMNDTRMCVEQIIKEIVDAMKKESVSFSNLFVELFGVGSAYEDTKIGEPNEFDIDIVLKLPEVLTPIFQKVDEFPGFTQVQLKNFETLREIDQEMFNVFTGFVDTENYILSNDMTRFIYKLFCNARLHHFRNGVIKIGTTEFTISKVELIEPALTLTIYGPDLNVSVDLVASFRFTHEFWPCNSRMNLCSSTRKFFLAPATPSGEQFHKRFWRPSFHDQEKQIVFSFYQLKPAIRVLKRIRDHFDQSVHSYAIKTLFLWEFQKENSSTLLGRSPLSYVILHMLELYLKCLMEKNIPYFWNKNLNLLSYLSHQEIEEYENQVATVLEEIKTNPEPDVLLKYLI